MPALILIALAQATQPALARGLVPVCSAEGTHWVPADGKSRPGGTPEGDRQGACLHGWCSTTNRRKL